MALLQPMNEVRIVGKPELRVKATDNMELARGTVSRSLDLSEDFGEFASVSTVFLGRSCERAESADPSQDTYIGRVDVLIGREEDSLAVDPLVRRICHGANADEVGAVEQDQRVAV